jgi:hypothetical protein
LIKSASKTNSSKGKPGKSRTEPKERDESTRRNWRRRPGETVVGART